MLCDRPHHCHPNRFQMLVSNGILFRGNEFRTDFAKLDTFRYSIPGVPFAAITATATPEKLLRIRQGLGIATNAISIIEAINRPNLFFAAKKICGGSIQGQGDLDWLIPPCKDKGREYDPQEIPQTIIYVDHKPTSHKIAFYLQSLLPEVTHNRPQLQRRWDFDPRSRSERIITPYHATLSCTMKDYIRADWRSGMARILIATSAWGMGIDDPNVERVIQWKAKPLTNLDTLIQRFGRCARNPTLQGVCILYYEKDCLGDRLVIPSTGRTKRNLDGESKKRITADERRGQMETGLYKYINAGEHSKSNGNTTTISCRRKVILGYYADQQYSDPVIYTARCCDLCGIEEIQRFAPHLLKDVSFEKHKKPRTARAPEELQSLIRDLLYRCRRLIRNNDYPETKYIVDRHIITNKQIEIMAAKCHEIASSRDLFSIDGVFMDQLLAKYGGITSVYTIAAQLSNKSISYLHHPTGHYGCRRLS